MYPHKGGGSERGPACGTRERAHRLHPRVWSSSRSHACPQRHRRIRAGDAIRTRDNLLGRQELCQLSYARNTQPVGVRGLEPPTSASQTPRATGLRHTPPVGRSIGQKTVGVKGMDVSEPLSPPLLRRCPTLWLSHRAGSVPVTPPPLPRQPAEPKRTAYSPTKSRILYNTVLATAPNSLPTACRMA